MSINQRFTVFILLLSSLMVNAQKPFPTNRPAMSSMTVASDHQFFFLYIDNVLQNMEPLRSIKVEMIPEGDHYILLEIDNKDRVSIGQYVTLNRHNNFYWLDNQRNMYGISIGRNPITVEAVVEYLYTLPRPTIENYHHSDYNFSVDVSEQNFESNDFDFQRFISIIQSQSFESGKLSEAKKMLADNILSVEQIIVVCNLFSFENSKLDFAKSAFVHCSDKQNYYKVGSVFSFSSSRDELNQYISIQK